jgi:hypothetical protein
MRIKIRKKKAGKKMKSRPIKITPSQAQQNLHALDVLSGKITEPPVPPTQRIQCEAQIQTALFQWAQASTARYPELRLLFHVPNGGQRDIITGANLKQQGLRAGVPDLCLPVPRGRYHGLYLELKSADGRLQKNQRAWFDELSAQGYRAVVCYSFDEARQVIENYLNEK